MAVEHPFAARLRKAATHTRRERPAPENSFLLLAPDEAEALADLVDLLAEFMNDGMPEFTEQSWYDEEAVEGAQIMVFGHGWESRFGAALARLGPRG